MPAPEGFEAYPFGQDAPGVRWFSVTPSDTESLAALPRCLYVGGAGDSGGVYRVEHVALTCAIIAT